MTCRTAPDRCRVRRSAALGANIPILWTAFAVLIVAVICDFRSREIPDSLSMLLLALAVAGAALRWRPVSWSGLLLGLAVGFIAGLLLFRLGGLGGGDVKLISALGALLGFPDALSFLVYVAIAGGLLAIVAHLRRERDFPYAPAIALGLLTFIVRGYYL